MAHNLFVHLVEGLFEVQVVAKEMQGSSGSMASRSAGFLFELVRLLRVGTAEQELPLQDPELPRQRIWRSQSESGQCDIGNWCDRKSVLA